MPDRPKAGEHFVVTGRRDLLTVAECHAATTDDVTGVTRYVVMTPARIAVVAAGPSRGRWRAVDRDGAPG